MNQAKQPPLQQTVAEGGKWLFILQGVITVRALVYDAHSKVHRTLYVVDQFPGEKTEVLGDHQHNLLEVT